MKYKRKIGILTYYWTDNPGTFLQAYSVQTGLQKRFPDCRVELINYRFRRFHFRLHKYHVNPLLLVEDWRRYWMYRKLYVEQLLMGPEVSISAERSEIEGYIQRQKYDLVIVGADTVLQLLPRYLPPDALPIFWLPPSLSCRKVMFSASANALSVEELTPALRERMVESLNGFDLLGVRDDATYKLVNDLGFSDFSKLQMTPDPAFMVDLNYGCIESLMAKARFDWSKPTIGLCTPLALQGRLATYYKQKGFQTVSSLYEKHIDWAPLLLSPFQWMALFRYFTATVTDRFHGTLFSLRNLTPVVNLECDPALITSTGLSKRYTILRQFGLETYNLKFEKEKDFDPLVAAVDQAVATFDRAKIMRQLADVDASLNAYMNQIAALIE